MFGMPTVRLSSAMLAGALFLPIADLHAGAAARNGPEAGLKIEQLTQAQRDSMPDNTGVTLRGGKQVTLGELRAIHARKQARFANAPRLGQSAGFTLGALSAAGRQGGSAGLRPIKELPPSKIKMVPMQNVPMAAADYRSYCNGADASGCLYIPGEESLNTLPGYNGYIFSFDELVTDAGVCRSEGGIMYYGSCAYPYPVVYRANFNPGTPPAGQQIGAGVTSRMNCAAPFMPSVDPRGAIQLNFPVAAGASALGGSGARPTYTCVVQVNVPQ